MEINNNNSLYLHDKCEDKGEDKTDNGMQCENKISQSVTTIVSGGLTHLESSYKKIIKIKTMMSEAKISSSDIDESLKISNVTPSADKTNSESNKLAENSVNESAENEINKKAVIRSVSGGLDCTTDDETTQHEIVISKVPMIIEQKAADMTQSNGESEFNF